MPKVARKRSSLATVHFTFSLLLNVLVSMWNGLNNKLVGYYFQLVLICFPFSIVYIMCGYCEELEEVVLIFVEFAQIHQLVVHPLMTIDGDLDLGPHQMGSAALLWTVLVTDLLHLSSLELFNDLLQIYCMLQSLDLQLTTHENGSVTMAECVCDCVHGNGWHY